MPCGIAGAAIATVGATAPKKQKFFGSFFQKRTSFFPYLGVFQWT
jgi:hypothetical protein